MRASLIIAAVFLAAGIALGRSQEEGQEKKVRMQDLPPSVRQAVKQHSQGLKLRGLTQETKGGSVFYEAELDVKGRTRDVTFDASGKLVSVEEEVSIDSIPTAAREAIRKVAGKDKITLVESVTEGGRTVYEAHIQRGRGQPEEEIKVAAEGKPVQ